jgi:hypothetical protein
VLSGTAGAAITGGLLGALGSILPEAARTGMATGLAVLAVPVAVVELVGRRVRPWQRDRETPQRWMHRGPLAWAARNGFSLGLGAFTRLGFALWYVIPVAALLIANVPLAATVYGLYGFTRVASAVPLLAAGQRTGDLIVVSNLLRRIGPIARRLCAAHLLALGITTLIVVGA